jgi:hypothetical protein
MSQNKEKHTIQRKQECRNRKNVNPATDTRDRRGLISPCFSIAGLQGFYNRQIEHLMLDHYSVLATETRMEKILWIFLMD